MSEPKADRAAEQCLVEHRSLTHIKSALRVTLDWKVPVVGTPRKIASVRFALHSFQRHLQRLMSLEEEGGYLVIVGEAKPHWSPQVEALRAEHDQFRAALRDIVSVLNDLTADQPQQFDTICCEIDSLLQHVDSHDMREGDLLQEALTCDEGGEG